VKSAPSPTTQLGITIVGLAGLIGAFAVSACAGSEPTQDAADHGTIATEQTATDPVDAGGD